MKTMFITIAVAFLSAPAGAQMDDTGFHNFNDRLERMCTKEFVTLEQSRACKTGGLITFGAPESDTMDAYLVLLDQCTATYQDAGAQFAPAIPAAELRAACQTGLVWTRTVFRKGG